jgi:hypothetical protein
VDKRRDTLASTRMWLTQNLEGLRPDPLATLVKRVKNDRTRSDALTQLEMIHGALKMIPAMSGATQRGRADARTKIGALGEHVRRT